MPENPLDAAPNNNDQGSYEFLIQNARDLINQAYRESKGSGSDPFEQANQKLLSWQNDLPNDHYFKRIGLDLHLLVDVRNSSHKRLMVLKEKLKIPTQSAPAPEPTAPTQPILFPQEEKPKSPEEDSIFKSDPELDDDISTQFSSAMGDLYEVWEGTQYSGNSRRGLDCMNFVYKMVKPIFDTNPELRSAYSKLPAQYRSGEALSMIISGVTQNKEDVMRMLQTLMQERATSKEEFSTQQYGETFLMGHIKHPEGTWQISDPEQKAMDLTKQLKEIIKPNEYAIFSYSTLRGGNRWNGHTGLIYHNPNDDELYFLNSGSIRDADTGEFAGKKVGRENFSQNLTEQLRSAKGYFSFTVGKASEEAMVASLSGYQEYMTTAKAEKRSMLLASAGKREIARKTSSKKKRRTELAARKQQEKGKFA